MSKARGRPFEAGNNVGRGRPKGSGNMTRELRDLLDQYCVPVVRKCMAEALKGKPVALRLCMERMIPVRRDSPVGMEMPGIATVPEIQSASASVLQEVAGGNLTPLEGETICKMLENLRRAIETGELSSRIDKLEEHGAAEDARPGSRAQPQ